MQISLDEWLNTVNREYLTSFIPWGGAAVKFVVPSRDIETSHVFCGLGDAAASSGLLFVTVDARNTRLHMMDRVFHAIARQVDWDDLARSYLKKLLTSKNHVLPPDGDGFRLRTIADANHIPENELRRDIQRWLTSSILRDFQMANEFRIAMVRLIFAQLDPIDVSPTVEESIKQWLQGDLRRISALKSALIFQKIARHNARHMLLSLTHWLKLAGNKGLVLGLDISRYLVKRPKEPDGTFYYGSAAVLDVYEVLRQFIDGTDESESLFVVVLAPPEFLSDETRGIHRYDALKLRIWDEVRDTNRANPLGSLLRLSSASAEDVHPSSKVGVST